MDLIQLTAVSKNGKSYSTPIVIAVNVDDIAGPISNNGVTSRVVVRAIKGVDSQSRGLAKETYEVQEGLVAIRDASDHLFLCTVTSRDNRAASYLRVFIADHVSGAFVPAPGNVTAFYYAEDGSPSPIFYTVSQTVAQIVAQTAVTGSFWALNGNTVGSQKTLGTNDNFDLPFKTNNVIRGRFDTAGRFGIGVAPSFRLDVLTATNPLTAIARFFNTGTGFKIFANDSSPETLITGNPGDICVVNDGTNGFMYQKFSGVGTTGWAVVGASGNNWTLLGNALAGGEIFGSTNFQPVDFYTDNVLRGRINETGQFTLGSSTSYGAQLCVQGTDPLLGIQKWISSGGFEKAVVDSSGKFGINVLSPGALLDIKSVGSNPFNFVFRVQGQAGLLPNAFIITEEGNVGVGTSTPNNTFQVLDLINFDAAANFNTFIGFQAGMNTIGNGVVQTQGVKNTVVGNGAFLSNIIGIDNTIMGYGSGVAIISDQNSAFGMHTMVSTTTGFQNCSFGVNAFKNNVIGSQNCAFGTNALRDSNTDANTAFGSDCLMVSTGSQNTGGGLGTLKANTTGSENTGWGYGSLRFCDTGGQNTAFGHSALWNILGSANTGIGYKAGFANAGSGNVFIGWASGFYETGSNKLFIDNTTRASEADGRLKALVYGVFDAAVANQRFNVNARLDAPEYYVGGVQGASGTFTTTDLKTVTVVNGIVTSIV